MTTRRLMPLPLTVFLLAVPALSGGCADSAEVSPDGENASALTAAKADGGLTVCQASAILALCNDPLTDEWTLRDKGVHTRAARNIVRHRDGLDGLVGTEDDFVFTSLQDVDDVSWVGPVAFEQLGAAVASVCDALSGPVSVEVIMSPQPYSDSHLQRAIDLIEDAEHSIDVAMYSFRDWSIADAIGAAIARGVRVRVISQNANDDRNDMEGTLSARLEEYGADVRYVNKIMHHKFAVIDGEVEGELTPGDAVLLTGSGNWSYSAGTKYDENTVIVHGHVEVIGRFQDEFALMWNNSRPFDYNPNFEWTEALAPTFVPDDPRTEVVFTSPNFDTKITSYGAGFSVVSGRNTVSDRLVALIDAADESILVASGHLRSRPISEALLRKHTNEPWVDIHVYLDGQEYISAYWHDVQEQDQADCLVEAGDSESKRQKCLDKGFYYAYLLHASGIDVRFKHYSYRWHYSYAVQMHHKYFVIDDAIVASGSYNLSDNAEHNTLENVVIYDAAGFRSVVDDFSENFAMLWDTGRDGGLYEDLLAEVSDGLDDIPLVYDSMALTHPEVAELKAAIKAACAVIDTDDYKKHPEDHHVCPR